MIYLSLLNDTILDRLSGKYFFLHEGGKGCTDTKNVAIYNHKCCKLKRILLSEIGWRIGEELDRQAHILQFAP